MRWFLLLSEPGLAPRHRRWRTSLILTLVPDLRHMSTFLRVGCRGSLLLGPSDPLGVSAELLRAQETSSGNCALCGGRLH